MQEFHVFSHYLLSSNFFIKLTNLIDRGLRRFRPAGACVVALASPVSLLAGAGVGAAVEVPLTIVAAVVASIFAPAPGVVVGVVTPGEAVVVVVVALLGLHPGCGTHLESLPVKQKHMAQVMLGGFQNWPKVH